MKLTDTSIERSITVLVLLFIIVLTGVWSYLTLPRENNPEVIIPLIVVTTLYEGVAPADMETLVTIPIERELAGTSGVKQIISTSGEGVSSIQIEFNPDVEIEAALQRVRDKVDMAKSEIPPEIEDPMVSEVNFSEFPIMFLSLTGDVPLPVLTQFAEDLDEALETVPGVIYATVSGAIEREIQIIVDPKRSVEYGVSMADLMQLATVENVNTPAGSLEVDGAKYLVRVPGEFEDAKDIEALAVKSGPNGNVYLRDIATVVDGFADITSISRLNGQPAVTLTVSKRAGSNIITVSDSVYALVEQAEKNLLRGMKLHVTMDMAEDTRAMVSELENSILTGLVLVLVVVFVFLGFNNALFVSLAIPISMFITFTVLNFNGTTLNMVVLFSLMLSLGMLVDNGIVIVENIFRHMQMGKNRLEAAKAGAREVAWPITASTVTTIAAFSPMFFWPGIWGEFMVFLPMTVSISLAASLFVGLVVNPALASLFMRAPRKQKTAADRPPWLLRGYRKFLRAALSQRLATLVFALTTLIVIGVIYFRDAHIEFVPTTEPRRAYVDIDCPEGTNLATTDRIVKEVEAIVAQYQKDVDFIISNVGSRGVTTMDSGGGGGQTTHIGRVTLDFPNLEDCEVMPSVIVASMREQFGGITGAELTIEVEQEGQETGPPVNIEISGERFEVLADIAQRVGDIIRTVPDVVDVHDDYDKGKPEIRINVDREEALTHGLSTQFIGQVVNTAVGGRKAGEFREADEEYDVVLRFPEWFRADPRHLESMVITNISGQPVPLSSVATLTHGAGFGSITRIDRKRTITVSSEVENRSGAEVLADVREALENLSLPQGYQLSYTGENEDQEESQTFLFRAFIAALLLVFLVLVAQFNSILQPLVIMTSVVLSLAGVFLGLHAFDMAFGVIMTGIGCISLAGVVVNNAIVLIDMINQNRAEGMTDQDAIVDAGTTRFRPVMLTAITTILGLIPMAAGISFDFRNQEWIVGGSSSQWWGPMAIAVIFGLGFATMLTLLVVPALYSMAQSVERQIVRLYRFSMGG